MQQTKVNHTICIQVIKHIFIFKITKCGAGVPKKCFNFPNSVAPLIYILITHSTFLHTVDLNIKNAL